MELQRMMKQRSDGSTVARTRYAYARHPIQTRSSEFFRIGEKLFAIRNKTARLLKNQHNLLKES
jgi:hypothetical protein